MDEINDVKWESLIQTKKSVQLIDLKKLLFSVFCSLLILSACKREFTNDGNESAILLIPDKGDFRLNVLKELQDGNLLVAGTTIRYTPDGTKIGTDTATFYLINPDSRKVEIIDQLAHRFGNLYSAIGTPDGGMIIHYEHFSKASASIVRLDKNYKTIDSIPSDAWLINDVNTESKVNQLTQLQDGNYMLVSGIRNIKKLDIHLQTIWQKTLASTVIANYITEIPDGSILVAGANSAGASAYYPYLIKYLVNGSQKFNKGIRPNGSSSAFWDVIESHGNILGSGYFNYTGNFDGSTKGLMVNYNENGDSLNHKIIGNGNTDFFVRKIIPTNDGGYILLASDIIVSPTRAIRILKLDAELNTKWDKQILKFGKSNCAQVGIKLKDGRIVIGCYGEASSYTLNGSDASLIFLDKNGNY